jgi:16S rRNA (adenine1518-N6/adenine1519-N6)-dimethyltransferase
MGGKTVEKRLQPGVESSLAEARRLLRSFGFRVKKGLGQHFLVDEGVLQRIVSSAELSPRDTVIEVGPGLGLLTRELAQQAGQVIAIELDARLISLLNQTLLSFSNVNLISGDVLQIDLVGLIGGHKDGYKVVANLPYYIASPVLRRFLEASPKPHLMVVMVQKEVGEAIVAEPGEMSLLSVSVKQLHNSLAQGLRLSAGEAAHLLEISGIDPRRRAETLTLKEWAALAQYKGIEASC